MTLFIEVAHALGVIMTLILVIITSCVGISMIRNEGMKNFLIMQQKLAKGENPAAEMVKSVSLIIAGFLLLLPGFFTDFLGLLLLLPVIQKHLTVKLMPWLRVWPSSGAGSDGGYTIDGEFERKEREQLRQDDHDKHH